MPATRSVAALADRPYGLFEALLRGNAATALRLLEAGAAPGADPPALLFPFGNFSVLHAAVLGGCAAAIPALVAAGAPLDAPLQLPADGVHGEAAAPLLELLHACGLSWTIVYYEASPLSLAVSKAGVACVRQLLEQGADPAATEALWALCRLRREDPRACEGLLPHFLQHGLDPLAPMSAGHPDSLLVSCYSSTAALLLAHLEQQRAAGSLQLRSIEHAAQLVIGVAWSNGQHHLPLARHGIAALEQLLGLAGGGGGDAGGSAGLLAAADADMVQRVLTGVLEAGQPPVLEALLASRLPFDLAAHVSYLRDPRCPMDLPWSGPPLTVAAVCPNAAACVRLLHQAGAPLTAADLYHAIDQLAPAGVSALLACGAPAVDVSVPAVSVPDVSVPDVRVPAELYDFDQSVQGWSCEVLRALHAAERWGPGRDRPVAQMLEALWAAGYRPTVYRQARLPDFLRPAVDAPVFAELDPLALYDAAHPQHAELSYLVFDWWWRAQCRRADPAITQRLLFLARTGGAWSPATHQYWPLAFKQAARTLLLCAAAGSSSGSTAEAAQRVTRAAARRRPQRSPSEAARLLGYLPPGVLLHAVKLAAEPLSAWL